MKRPPPTNNRNDASRKLTGQRVEHHIDPGAVGGRQKLLLEPQRPRIADVSVVKPHRAQRVPLAPASGGENLRAPMPAQLHRRHPHPTGGGVHQHPLTGLHARPAPDNPYNAVKNTTGTPAACASDHAAGTAVTNRASTTASEPTTPSNPITASPTASPSTPGPTSTTTPGTLGPQFAATGIHPQRHQHIPEIHPDRGHRHPHLPGGQFHRPGRGDHHVLQRAATAGSQPPPARRAIPTPRPRPPTPTGPHAPRRSAPLIAAHRNRLPL